MNFRSSTFLRFYALVLTGCAPKPTTDSGAGIDASSMDVVPSMDGSVASDAVDVRLLGDVCARPSYPDGFPVIGRQPCVIVHPISTVTHCTLEGATIDFQSVELGMQRLPPGFHGVTTSQAGCTGAFTITINHPDFELSTTTHQSFRDRQFMANSDTQVVVIELTPRGQSMADAGSERDGD